jgi:hypothetical protein
MLEATKRASRSDTFSWRSLEAAHLPTHNNPSSDVLECGHLFQRKLPQRGTNGKGTGAKLGLRARNQPALRIV